MSTVSQALGLPPEEAIAYLRAKTAVTSETYLDVWRRANVKAFTVAGAATQALAQDFLDEITAAAETGSTQRDFAATFDSLVAKHGWSHSGSRDFRARIIYETNLSVAYSAGRYSQMVEPETLAQYPFWEYVHSGALHPRHEHKSWNGLVLRCDDPWWSTHYPPNGWGCGCWVRPVSARDLARYGKSGPDAAPPIEYRAWTNRKTGKVEQVPKGIDPGWDYNPGAEYSGRAGGVTMPAGAVLTPRSRTLGEALERARRVTGGTAGSGAAGAAAVSVGAGAPAAPAEVRRFADAVLSGAIKDRERSVIVARLDDAVAEVLETAARDVELSAFRVMKVAGRAEEMGGLRSTAHPEITPEAWANVGEIIAHGEVWIDDVPGPYRQVLVHGEAQGRTMMAIVRVVSTPDGDRLIVPTYSQSGARRLRRLTRAAKRIRSAS